MMSWTTCLGRASSRISSSSLMPCRRSLSLACLCCVLVRAASISALQHSTSTLTTEEASMMNRSLEQQLWLLDTDSSTHQGLPI